MSEQSILHLVKVRFDRRTAAATPEWLNARYRFFAEHTLKSLQAQTFKDWTLWINCQEGMEGMLDALRPLVPLGTIFTFGDGPPQVTAAFDYAYISRIDSDDLFSRDALALANACRPKEPGRVEASLFKRGYLYDVRTGQLGVYRSDSPPFHTIMFPRDTFLDPAKYRAVWDKVGDHSRVGAALPCQRLPDWKFCVLIHNNNFLSTMSYGCEPNTWVERDWSLERWMNGAVTFDVDDFQDRHAAITMSDLIALKARYAGFRCTLFIIPWKTSPSLLAAVRDKEWIELAVHGITHEPNEELKAVDGRLLGQQLAKLDMRGYVKGFRPPGWFIESGHVEALSRAGFWVALHKRDQPTLGPLCRHGYYVCDEGKKYWHGHCHDVCNNWLHKLLPELLNMWPRDQRFLKVSESICVTQGQRNECNLVS